MKRWYLAAVAGLCSVGPLSAQPGTLAPTAPVVPAPVLQNGSVLTPAGGWGGGGIRPLNLSKWSPFRNPATASATEPTAPSGFVYGQPLPPLPAGVSGADGTCGPSGCARGGRDRSCWDRFKSWVTYHPSNTDLPRCQPTPYVTPLLGMYPCASANCGYGCGSGNCAVGQPVYGAPAQPYLAPEKPMPPPVPSGTAGAVPMPPRGTLGATAQTWPGRTTPAPAQGPVVGASYKVPGPK